MMLGRGLRRSEAVALTMATSSGGMAGAGTMVGRCRRLGFRPKLLRMAECELHRATGYDDHSTCRVICVPHGSCRGQKGILQAMIKQPQPASTMKDPVTWLYPPIEPYNTGRLQVSPIHEIYLEESGNPSGKPVIFLHGGPGGGSDPKQRRFFHPEKYRIVNFDQRGCGKSTPYASLEANTTWDLVADIEKVRSRSVYRCVMTC